MEYEAKILEQLKILNQKLDKISHPIKWAWFNFKAGIFRSLGSLFGTIVVASIIIYLLSQSKIGQDVSNLIQSNQLFNYPISVPVPDQP